MTHNVPRHPRPTPARLALVLTTTVAMHGLLLAWARSARPLLESSACELVSLMSAGVASALVIGAVGEWLVHRFLMHHRWRLPLLRAIYDLHHIGHHFIHFTPEHYVHAGPINYIPVWPPEPKKLCSTSISRLLSMSAQFIFYGSVALTLVLIPTVWLAHNALFASSFVVTVGIEIVLFVRLHDAVHYPGQTWLDRLPMFARLDRHHYLHHIDAAANTNFLLPLGDLLFGTLRVRRTPWERARFPSYAEARKTAPRATSSYHGLSEA